MTQTPDISATLHPGKATSSPDEIARFTAMAESWWDPNGKFRPLHRFNPVRLAYLRRVLSHHFERDPLPIAPFGGLSLLDVGCGGGLLSEPLARMGFSVTGIDAGERNIAVAKLHAEQGCIDVEYQVGGPESLSGRLFDIVISMEVIEHVPDPAAFVASTVTLLKPGGIFVGATMNRTPKAYALAVVGAERILRWLPPGTHDWKKFVRPSEFVTWLRASDVETLELIGTQFSPFTGHWRETPALDVNYMIMGKKAG